jgi:hypothetical protein
MMRSVSRRKNHCNGVYANAFELGRSVLLSAGPWRPGRRGGYGVHRIVIEGESFRKPKPMPENGENVVANYSKKPHS